MLLRRLAGAALGKPAELSGIAESAAMPEAAELGRPLVQLISTVKCDRLVDMLGQHGWTVTKTPSFLEPLQHAARVVILRPDRSDRDNARELCTLMSTWSNRALVLFLEPSSSQDDAISILEAGADDCLVSPHNHREIVARVRALHRRVSRPVARDRIQLPGAKFEPARRRIVTASGATVELTERQTKLLSALLANAGFYLCRDRLLHEVLGPDADAFDRVIDVHVCRLKRKLEEAQLGDLIVSTRGAGYRIDLPAHLQNH
jgi:DNA-binding response OmpR family regulator